MSPAPAKGAAPAFFLFHGTDEFQVAGAAHACVDQLCPPAQQAFGLETVDGAVETGEEIVRVVRRCLEALQTVGFFGAGKVVWLRDAVFLGDMQRMANEEVKARLAELAGEVQKGLLPGQHLVISTPRLDKRTAFFKACQPLARASEFNLPEKDREIKESARDFCAEQFEGAGLRPRDGALESFLDRCGNDRRQIANEVEKLSLFLGDRKEITVEDVRAIVSPARELPMWDLAEAFGKREFSAALAILRQLLFPKESPVGLLIGLEGRVRDLLVLKECVQRRWARLTGGGDWPKLTWSAPPEADALLSAFDKDPRKMNEWRAGKLAEQAARFTLEELRECHRQMLETHERMVSSPVAPEMLIELFLIRTLGGPRAAPAR